MIGMAENGLIVLIIVLIFYIFNLQQIFDKQFITITIVTVTYMSLSENEKGRPLLCFASYIHWSFCCQYRNIMGIF